MILIPELDLDKSFQKLKMELDHSYKITNPAQPETYAYALGRVQSAIRVHISRCVGDTADLPKETEDDIKDVFTPRGNDIEDNLHQSYYY